MIELQERTTAAAVVAADGLYLVDAAGKPFKQAAARARRGRRPADRQRRDPHALRRGPRGRRRARPAAAWPCSRPGSRRRRAARPDAGEVAIDGRGATVYTCDDAVAVRLGAAEGAALVARLARFDAAWAALAPDERRRARAIHLDRHPPDLVTVAFTPELSSINMAKTKTTEIIVGLDIGTTKIACIVGEVTEDGVDIIGIGTAAVEGAAPRRRRQHRRDRARRSRPAVDEAENMAGCEISTVYAAISGAHVRGLNTHGIVAVKDKEIRDADIARVIDAGQGGRDPDGPRGPPRPAAAVRRSTIRTASAIRSAWPASGSRPRSTS